jgi:hypothetical protein
LTHQQLTTHGIYYSQEVEKRTVFLDETLIETAALRLFDDFWKFLGQAAHPSVTIYSSHGVFEATFSGEELDQPLGALTNVPWKRYRKKGLTLVYDLGE